MGLLQIGNAERSALSMEGVGAAFLILGFLEIGKDIVPNPNPDCPSVAKAGSLPAGRGYRPGR